MFGACNPQVLPGSKQIISGFIIRTLRGRSVAVCNSNGRAQDFRCMSSYVRNVIQVVGARSSFVNPMGLKGPGRFSVLRLTRGIVELAGSGSGLVFGPLPRSSPGRHRPSVALTGRGLN